MSLHRLENYHKRAHGGKLKVKLCFDSILNLFFAHVFHLGVSRFFVMLTICAEAPKQRRKARNFSMPCLFQM